MESVVLPGALRVVGRRAFAHCERLGSVCFGKGAQLEEVGLQAFLGCGLESFEAPRNLKKVGIMAFGGCRALGSFKLNEGVRELAPFCFWMTRIAHFEVPPQTKTNRELLGLGQSESGVLRLPDGLGAVGDGWFARSDVERVVVSKNVKKIGDRAFFRCARLREVVFEPDSHLESIGEKCFEWSWLKQICIPRSVRRIEERAFGNCGDLAQLSFQSLSKLEHIGDKAFGGTKLTPEAIKYPSRLCKAEHKNEW